MDSRFSQSQCVTQLWSSAVVLIPLASPEESPLVIDEGLEEGRAGFLFVSSVSLPGPSLLCFVSPAWHRWHHSASLRCTAGSLCCPSTLPRRTAVSPPTSISIRTRARTHTHSHSPPVSVHTQTSEAGSLLF